VWQLLQEFQALISSYILKYSPPDAQEWRSVIQEVTHFLQADVGMPVPRAPGQAVPFRLSLRCAANQAEVKLQPHKMLLHDCVLISYYPRQVGQGGTSSSSSCSCGHSSRRSQPLGVCGPHVLCPDHVLLACSRGMSSMCTSVPSLAAA
jgi:hypothetical protein